MHKNLVKVTIECVIYFKGTKYAIKNCCKHFTYYIQMLHQIYYIQLIKGLLVIFKNYKFINRIKSMFKGLLNVAFNWALTFIRLVEFVLFWHHKMLAVDLQRLYLYFLLILCWLKLFETFLGYLQWSILIKMYIHTG
jgi:ethanolamine transporter EutH